MTRNALIPSRARRNALTGFNPLMSLNRDINRLFDDLLQPAALPTMADPAVATALITPQINVSETDTEIRVAAELPGVDLCDLEVDVMDDMLVIRGEKRLERSDEDENFHFVERAYGSFQRTVQLPFAADPDQVQANFENGVLSITVPKSDQQQRAHRIDVRPGSVAQGGERTSQLASQQTSKQASSPASEQGGAQENGGAKASGQKSEGPSSKRGQSSSGS